MQKEMTSAPKTKGLNFQKKCQNGFPPFEDKSFWTEESKVMPWLIEGGAQVEGDCPQGDDDCDDDNDDDNGDDNGDDDDNDDDAARSHFAIQLTLP